MQIEMKAHVWSSEMTFGEFVLGLYKESAFPYDRHLEFSSRTQGTAMGNLLVKLLERSSFIHSPKKSSQMPGGSIYVYEDKRAKEGLWHRTIQIKVNGISQEAGKSLGILFFPLECDIEIECIGFPF